MGVKVRRIETIQPDQKAMKYIDRLESVTRFPSIETFHKLGNKGQLNEEPSIKIIDGATYTVTEKVDGTNVRIIITSHGKWYVGSRNEILYAGRDDLGSGIAKDTNGIITWLVNEAPFRITIDEASDSYRYPDPAFVIYGELYGGKINRGGKIYGGNGKVDFRVFAQRHFADLDKVMSINPERAAQLRESRAIGRLLFHNDASEAVTNVGRVYHPFKMVPVIAEVAGKDIPRTVRGVYEWMKGLLKETLVPLGDGGNRKPEGFVISGPGTIFKLRFEDYERTLRKRGEL